MSSDAPSVDGLLAAATRKATEQALLLNVRSHGPVAVLAALLPHCVEVWPPFVRFSHLLASHVLCHHHAITFPFIIFIFNFQFLCFVVCLFVFLPATTPRGRAFRKT